MRVSIRDPDSLGHSKKGNILGSLLWDPQIDTSPEIIQADTLGKLSCL